MVETGEHVERWMSGSLELQSAIECTRSRAADYGVSPTIWDHAVLYLPLKWPNTTNQDGRAYAIYLPWRDGRLSWPS